MRMLSIVIVLAVASAPAAVDARSFWQTYGATVASPEGCAWNLNSDYFVPRMCDTGQYDLFSPCKTSHYLSPACKSLHPVYGGYCTPFGECHYKWRDHVYKKHCGCTPLACTHGPWELEKCRKHCLGPCSCGKCGGGCHGGGGCGGVSSGACGDAGRGAACSAGCGGFAASGPVNRTTYIAYADGGELPNVEPFGGESLGTIQAFPLGLSGAAGMAPGAGGIQGMGAGMQGGAFRQGPAGAAQSPAIDARFGIGPDLLTVPNSFGN